MANCLAQRLVYLQVICFTKIADQGCGDHPVHVINLVPIKKCCSDSPCRTIKLDPELAHQPSLEAQLSSPSAFCPIFSGSFQSTLRCRCLTAQELLIEHLAARSVVHTNKAQREELNYKDVGEIWLARLPSLRNVSTSMGVTVVCAKLHTLAHQQSVSQDHTLLQAGRAIQRGIEQPQQCSCKAQMPYTSRLFRQPSSDLRQALF